MTELHLEGMRLDKPVLATRSIRIVLRSVNWPWLINRAAWAALVIVYLIILNNYFFRGEWGNDARAYWTAWPDLYDAPWHGHDSYVYSPAFAQAIRPLTLLDWPIFYAVWTAIQLGVLILLAGPVLAAILLVALQPFWKEVAVANVDMTIGLAIALGFRYPATWAFVLLTKVTPGIGLLWFAVRREWRKLGVALGATAALIGASVLIGPSLWLDWGAFLVENAERPPDFPVAILIEWPLLPRLALAAILVTWGAWTNRPWTVVLAAFVAAPLPTTGRATMLVAILPLVASRFAVLRVPKLGPILRLER